MKHRVRTASLVFFTFFIPLAAAQEHDHGAADERKLGEVSFLNSCAAGVQADFEKGIALLHSFWYGAAAETFRKVAVKDPTCAMAFWGIGETYYHPLWQPPNGDQLAAGAEALQKAEQTGAKSERERAYVAALAGFYRDWPKRDHATRAAEYAAKMEQVAKDYPTDREATIFYALALRATAPPADKTYAVQKKAGALLEPIFLEQPNHPGVAHYIIHCYDYPPLAADALGAAKRYAQIAPDSPHALHMPSHIFIRVGDWDASIASNQASADAAKRNNLKDDELHALDYLEYAALQQGRDQFAREIKTRAAQVGSGGKYDFAGLYAIASVSARYFLERKQWTEAASLQIPTGVFPGGALAWTEANLYFARAFGAARSGNVRAAQKERKNLDALRETELQQKDAYWANQIAIQIKVVDSWIRWAEKRPEDALQLAREAADAEDQTDKHPVTPGPLLPARELYADMLIASKQPNQAFIQYEAVLKEAPNRLLAVYGAARALELGGFGDRAKARYAQVVQLTKNADSERPEILEARTMLSSNP